MSARKVRAEHQQHEDSVRQRGYWGFLLSLLTATSDDKLLTTSLVQIDTRIPGSGCSLGGRLNDSEKVRVSTLDADAALCRPLTQKIQISLFIVSSSCLDTWLSCLRTSNCLKLHRLTCSTLCRASKSASVGRVCHMSEDVSYFARRRGNLRKTST